MTVTYLAGPGEPPTARSHPQGVGAVHNRRVTVGEYAGVPLQDAGDSWRNGGVFLLRKPARASASETVHGWTTTVVAGQTAVITCGPSVNDL